MEYGMVYGGVRRTGLLSQIAAGTATAGHIGAFRWISATHACKILSTRAVWSTITGFPTEQELGLNIVPARSYSASHSGVGSSALTLTGNELKQSTGADALGVTNAPDMAWIMAGTAELTAGTHTLDATPIADGSTVELKAADTVFRGVFAIEKNFLEETGTPMILRQNEGLVLQNNILMGATGTARVRWAVNFVKVPL